MSGKIGVITEQGYPAGQFGFDPLSKKEQAQLETAKETDKQKSNK